MRTGTLLAALVTIALLPTPALAQSPVESGAAAMLAGDYPRAVTLLKPLADAEPGDPAAQFLTAVLYETGTGTGINLFRACRLYWRASHSSHPFAVQARKLSESLQRQLGPPAVQWCQGNGPLPFPDGEMRNATAPSSAEPAVLQAVTAIVRGDADLAAAALKPIAEVSSGADPTAEFLLAGLYDSGRGVPYDELKSCALYERSGGRLGTGRLFGHQATELVQHFLQTHGLEAFNDCRRMAQLGLDSTFAAVVFTLGPQYWIKVELSGVTISYQGKEKRSRLQATERRTQFVSIEHTPLTTRRPPEERHFIQIFSWNQTQAGRWLLRWQVFEVIRDDLVAVGGADLAVAEQTEPPATLDPSLRAAAILRVNASGDAEWEARGRSPQKRAIPSDDERRATASELRAREEAFARVDWTRTADRGRVPSFRYAAADGCGDLEVYGWTADRMEAIDVRADASRLQLSPNLSRSFDIAAGGSPVTVLADVYEQPLRSMLFCTDVGHPEVSREPWRAVRGIVTITVSERNLRVATPDRYRATVTIADAEFVSQSGVHSTASGPITLSAWLGIQR